MIDCSDSLIKELSRKIQEGRAAHDMAQWLLNWLGYPDENIFHQFGVWLEDERVLFTAVAASRVDPPWLLVDVAGRDSPAARDGLVMVFRDYSNRQAGHVVAAQFVLSISPQQVLVEGPQVSWDSKTDELEELRALLKPPDALPVRAGDWFTPFDQVEWWEGPTSDRATQTPHSDLNLDNYAAALAAAFGEDPTGRSLEEVAHILLGSLHDVEIRDINVRSISSEIDLVCRSRRTQDFGFLNECTRYFVVECKNWNRAVDSKAVRDFVRKVRGCRANLGILFSMKGITGTRSDAVFELVRAWDVDGIAIAVVTEADLLDVLNGRDFYRVLEDAYERARFTSPG